MAVNSSDTPDIHVIYFSADAPAELFRGAAEWAATQDGGFAIEAITWGNATSHNGNVYEMAVYYEPQ